MPSAPQYFVYPVHVSRAFLMPQSLEATIYLVFLRFLAKRYAEAFDLANSCECDRHGQSEGQDDTDCRALAQDDETLGKSVTDHGGHIPS